MEPELEVKVKDLPRARAQAEAEVEAAVTRLVEYMRENADDNLELEIGVGRHGGGSGGQFDSGYQHTHRTLITELMQRLGNNATRANDPRWRADEMVTILKSYYDNDVVKESVGSRATFMRKEKLFAVDIETDLEYSLRVRLARETPMLVADDDLLTRVRVKSLRFINRVSFHEQMPAESESALDLAFQWDLSKVSRAAPTKLESAQHPCSYHAEVELKTKLPPPTADRQLDADINSIVARALLARGRALLGTVYLNKKNQLVPLNPVLQLAHHGSSRKR